MWPVLYTPQGDLKYEKLNYRITKFSMLLDELGQKFFSGYVEILAPHEHGLVLMYNGKIHSCFYEGTEDLVLSRQEIVRHFLSTETKERETIINVGELNPRIIVALSALESRQPAHRELETVFLDLNKLFETLSRKHFTGTLRFYSIRNNTRLGNILLRLKKITVDELRQAIRLQLSGEKALRLGDALVQIGAIGKQDLEDALDRQAYTRKGSDQELALALFSEGEFLGAYRVEERKLHADRKEILSWVGVPEVLMDIIDGILPSALEAAEFSPSAPVRIEPAEKEFPAAQRAQESAAPQAATAWEGSSVPDDFMIRELTEETFMLKADDLILDIQAADARVAPLAEGATKPIEKNLLAQTQGAEDGSYSQPLETKDAQHLERIAENFLAQNSGEAPVPPVPEAAGASLSGESAGLDGARERGIDLIEKILKARMGFLGVALLEREKRKVDLLALQTASPAQLRGLNQRLFQSASRIVGGKMAETIMYEIEEKIGG